LRALAGQDITVEGVLCFEFEGTAIDHLPKVERREPGQAGPTYPSSIWLSVGDGALQFNEDQLKRWHGKRVTVSGNQPKGACIGLANELERAGIKGL
jgi:hypothetical protein